MYAKKLSWLGILLFAFFTPILKVVGNTFLVLAVLSLIFYFYKFKNEFDVKEDLKYTYVAIGVFAFSMLPSVLTSDDILHSFDTWITLFIFAL